MTSELSLNARQTSHKVTRSPSRVVIAHVHPEIEEGQFAIKRIQGEPVRVRANIFADGHGVLSAILRFRKKGDAEWTESPMQELGNDMWSGEFTVTGIGEYEYGLLAWLNDFETWRRDLSKKADAGQDVSVDLVIGAALVEEAGQRASDSGIQADAHQLRQWESYLRAIGHAEGARPNAELKAAMQMALDEKLRSCMAKYPDLGSAAVYEKPLRAVVDRPKAGFSSWYEMFPRSWAREPGRHGTFRDCEAALPYIASLGFDVLYLPPIHPIGRAGRKGPNNAPVARPEDVGSPWAIGAAEGGHTSIHPQLGTLDDFEHLCAAARQHGLEVALDLAYQCSPDHPYVTSHPEWFRLRPDGSVQYAENPPKKYEDIYPFDFDTRDWRALWEELVNIVVFWIEKGIRIFRVDNPHTKPFAFWEWLIHGIKEQYPEVIFLSEAFTRPQVMQRLAKLGFSQSYTYFAWRNTKWELTDYFTELTQTEMREYFRPNLWPNTPDILTEVLQTGGRPAFIARLVLAATLGANYGIYGPAFELCENRPLVPGKEEYLDAEKYQIRQWDLATPWSISGLVARVNRARRENPALQSDAGLHFHRLDNDQLIAYSKSTPDRANAVLVVVNLDSRYTQSGWVDLALEEMGLSAQVPFRVLDVLTDAQYEWQGPRNYVQLDPHSVPAHILVVKRQA